jgi:hypothetical protein
MSDAIISVEGLGKKYRISHQGERQRYVALRDVIAEKARAFSEGGNRKSEIASHQSSLQSPNSDLRPQPNLRSPASSFSVSVFQLSEF